MDKKIKSFNRMMTIDRCITAVGLAAAICTIIGISAAPSELVVVNILTYIMSGLIILKELGDMRKISRAEKAAAQAIAQMEQEMDQEEK